MSYFWRVKSQYIKCANNIFFCINSHICDFCLLCKSLNKTSIEIFIKAKKWNKPNHYYCGYYLNCLYVFIKHYVHMIIIQKKSYFISWKNIFCDNWQTFLCFLVLINEFCTYICRPLINRSSLNQKKTCLLGVNYNI